MPLGIMPLGIMPFSKMTFNTISFSIMTITKMIFSIMTVSITTFSIAKLSIFNAITQHYDSVHKDIQQNNKNVTLNITLFSIITQTLDAKAECRS